MWYSCNIQPTIKYSQILLTDGKYFSAGFVFMDGDGIHFTPFNFDDPMKATHWMYIPKLEDADTLMEPHN